MISLKKVDPKEVQTTIRNEIKTAYADAKIIAAEYGTLYERDVNSSMYEIENSKTFFLTQDGYVYIVYAYGNYDYTNEMDVIIF